MSCILVFVTWHKNLVFLAPYYTLTWLVCQSVTNFGLIERHQCFGGIYYHLLQSLGLMTTDTITRYQNPDDNNMQLIFFRIWYNDRFLFKENFKLQIFY